MTANRHPDPARGIFETLLVVDGGPVELDAHLERLASSLGALYGAGLPGEACRLVVDRAAGLGLGRLRLSIAPADDCLSYDVETATVDPALLFPTPDRGADLRGLLLAGGLGAHKWADRSPLPPAAEGAGPLLLDEGEEVLEAGWANVFAARDGVLVTPPADGRILPGVARAGVIEVARAGGVEVQERRLGRAELLAADEVLLTGSVRGVQAARSLDGVPLGLAADLSRLVGDGLWRRWRAWPEPAAARAPAGAPPPGPLVR